MTKMMKKVANGVKTMASRATGLVRDKKGENYVDTAVKILIAVVLRASIFSFSFRELSDPVTVFRVCETSYPA